jgi:protein gp37
MPTKIEWAEETWNPVTGCTPISEGCRNCYAERMSKRLAGRCGYPSEDPFKVTLHPDKLDQPLRWKKPRMIFVCSMGDLFHEDVPFDQISQVFDVMCSCSFDAICSMEPGHTFMVLTKRPERIKKWLWWMGENWSGDSPANVTLEVKGHFGENIWLGVTAENQQRANERIPILLQIPAAVRFVSVEPMLGPVDLTRIGGDWYGNGRINALKGLQNDDAYVHEYNLRWKAKHCGELNWVICGSESGPNHRKTKIEWIRDLREQCISANVPFFLKQMEINGRMVKMPELDGKIWAQFPEVQVVIEDYEGGKPCYEGKN